MFICPICKEKLIKSGKSLVCENNHCFDYAKQGYINLLPVQQKKSLHPGDSKEMLIARRNFLSGGFYEPLMQKISDCIEKFAKEKTMLVDIGCGEGYYTTSIREKLGFDTVVGTDIAKDAVRMCCSRSKEIDWIVATASHLPVADSCADVVTAVFSLLVPEEYHRVLKDGGIIVEVSAGNNHLIELKRLIYDDVFVQNKKQQDVESLFKTVYEDEVVFSISPDDENLKNLLAMTPHINRIKEEKKRNLCSSEIPELTVDCKLRVLMK